MIAIRQTIGSHGHMRTYDIDEFMEVLERKENGILKERQDVDRFKRTSYISQCITLDQLLEAQGASPETPVDFISIDVEGGEIDILRDFPFHKYMVHVFLLETDHDSSFILDTLLIPNGYQKVAVLGKDHVYAHSQFLFALAGSYFMGQDSAPSNPFMLKFPPYINIEPYNDTFPVFQRRFLDREFGK